MTEYFPFCYQIILICIYVDGWKLIIAKDRALNMRV